jgi:hypothetical protein
VAHLRNEDGFEQLPVFSGIPLEAAPGDQRGLPSRDVMCDVVPASAVHFSALVLCHWIQEAVHGAAERCLAFPP